MDSYSDTDNRKGRPTRYDYTYLHRARSRLYQAKALVRFSRYRAPHFLLPTLVRAVRRFFIAYGKEVCMLRWGLAGGVHAKMLPGQFWEFPFRNLET
jgi:hypothetical protein